VLLKHRMKTAAILIPALAVLLISACKKEDAEAVPRLVENPTISSLPATVNKSQLLQLVNEVRQRGCQCGDTYYYPAAKVTWNSKLELAAYNHSSDMYQNKYFSHTAPDGSNAGVRIDRVGYNWLAFGENIATGYTSEREVVDAWIESPGHCKNIMNKAYTEMGVARVGTYWTQEFAAR
jgi:uncharacterized protein YkwD